MRLTSVINQKDINKAFNKGCDKIIAASTFVLKDILLAWPRALFIALPLASKDIKALSYAKTAFIPQIREISTLASTLFSRLPSSINKIQKLTAAIGKLANAAEGLTCDQVLENLEKQRAVFQELGSFVDALLLPEEEELAGEGKEFIPELVQTAALLNALIANLSKRSGIFSSGKEEESGSVVAARAQAVVVRERARADSESPVNPYSEAGIGVIDEAPVAMAEPHRAAAFNPKSKPPRSLVVLRPVPLKVIVHSADEEKFLKDAKALSTPKKMSIADYIVSFVHFIAVDILFGVPRFLVYDLPHLIINFQKTTSHLVSAIHPSAKALLELKDILKGIHGLMYQLDRLAPVINGVELYLAKNIEPDAIALKEKYELLMASIATMLETTDVRHIHVIKKEMKALLFKVNPLLIKALNALHGRSIFTAFTSSNKASGSPKPTVKGGGDGASHVSEATGSSSSGDVDTAGSKSKQSVGAQLGGFFVGLGKGIKKGLSTPTPGGASGSDV